MKLAAALVGVFLLFGCSATAAPPAPSGVSPSPASTTPSPAKSAAPTRTYTADESALIEILTKPRNAILKQYQRMFEFENVHLHFTVEAIGAVAREALARKVGARGLRMILEELMLDLMFHLPNSKRVRDIEITRDMVERRDLSLCLLEKAG